MADYLLEIGLEEIPARFILDLSLQLENLVVTFLEENRIKFKSIERFSTPRRLSVLVHNIDDKQADLSESVKGPALKIAKDSNGNWTKAALGFIKGQQASIEDIEIKNLKGEDYIFVNKFYEGQPVSDVLKAMNKVILSMNFPVSMRWNNIETSYIRPIHWIVSLLDDLIVSFECLNIQSGRHSYGHRFLGDRVDIDSALKYEEILEQEFVIPSFEKRQAIIKKQIEKISNENGWQVPIDNELLDEVTSIVEWPTAFYGKFDEKYLGIPAIISITAMKDHQRYFYVLDNNTQELLPYFISVRNGNDNHIENVIKGNLKVLRARLEDALFFYEEDLNKKIEFYVEKLDHVNEHYKLGTFADKQKRVSHFIPEVANIINLSPDELKNVTRASEIYKFDLMTGVVDEFSELQGQIGEIYAQKFGENEAVAKAIGSQYLPNTSGGVLPDTIEGSVLAFADKLDTIYQYFKVGMIPTGSNDPYALRRQCAGLVEIILAQKWDFDLLDLLNKYQENINNVSDNTELINKISEFTKARLQQHLSKSNVDYDIINAVIKVNHLNVYKIYQNALFLSEYKLNNSDNYRIVNESMTRISNLGQDVMNTQVIDKKLSQGDSENKFIDFVSDIQNIKEIDNLYSKFLSNIDIINEYFDNNMVNHEDLLIRNNRKQCMVQLSNLIQNYLDPKEIITKY